MASKRKASALRRLQQSTSDHACRLRFETLEGRCLLAIVAGQIDDFQDGTTQHWANGLSKPDPTNAAGGRGGPSDLYLQVSSGTFGGGPRLVTYNLSQWIGDYIAAGVSAVSMDLKNFTPSDESIRFALRSAHSGPTTPGYASTNKFVVPADNLWHRALFSLDSGSLTAINSPTPLSTFLTTVAEARIVEADAAPALVGDAGNFQIGVDNIRAIASPDFTVVEPTIAHLEGNSGATQYVFEVFLSGVGGGTVEYATADNTATTADNDYVATSGTLTFAPGVTSQLITVAVNGDTNLEPNESFFLNFSNPTSALLGTSQATGTIVSDDAIITLPKLFYKGSTKWNITNGATFSDDNAIAPDKTAYLPGSGTSAFSAVSSYDKGINGLMVDLSGAHGAITAGDFIFKVGNNNSPNLWATATAPTTVTTRAGAGTGGSDRVELMWADNAIQKQWLEVIVKGNDALGGSNTNTGLASSYVFLFGNGIGESGNAPTTSFQVTSSDEISARNDPHGIGNPATRSNNNDFNRDGLVNSADQIIARNNITGLSNQLKLLVVGGGGPFAPAAASGGDGGSSGDAGIASALASSSAMRTISPTLIDSVWMADRISSIALAETFSVRSLDANLVAIALAVEPESPPDDALDSDTLNDLISLD